MQIMTISTADCAGEQKNTHYPNQLLVATADELREAVCFDHVCAFYKNDHRSKNDFLESSCLPFDCDNDGSDDPDEWVSPEDVAAMLPDVTFYVVFSRHDGKQKGERSARPRFHVYFPTERITDRAEYERLKDFIVERFPFFDSGAKDSARFFYGVKDPRVKIFNRNGTKLLADEFAELDIPDGPDVIPEGKRNSTLSRIAGKLVKRYGGTDEAKEMFLEQAERCVPPLDDQELETIWRSAAGFGRKVSVQPGYIPPEQFNFRSANKPEDFSDVGQAKVFTNASKDKICYTPATDYLVYDGVCWKESISQAHHVFHAFTDVQLKEAKAEKLRAEKWMFENKASALIAANTKNRARCIFTKDQEMSYSAFESALNYRDFVIRNRDSKGVTAVLREARPMVEIEPDELDEDPFLLNTPSYTYDLRKGLNGVREHRPKDYITKCTGTDPGDEGREIWAEALDTFFCGDADLIRYVQQIAGIAAVGHVFNEALIIAYGGGKNGKSTFWNVLARVLGTYSGSISADALTVGCRRNVKPEMAEARGERLLIASELEEGTRLNTSIVKQFCSTDRIFAEKKYCDPFSFTPSHTLILYTNHLPKVGANDEGTWRRLVVIPFSAHITGSSDIKNYADYLYDKAAPAILSWIIKGAEEMIRREYKFDPPACVLEATGAYRESSDWMEHFLNECCDKGDDLEAPSGALYRTYRYFCDRTGDYTRSTTDFYSALELAGYVRKKKKSGNVILGLSLKNGADDDEFL